MPARVYVGHLPFDARHRDLEKIFEKFGKVSDVDIKVF